MIIESKNIALYLRLSRRIRMRIRVITFLATIALTLCTLGLFPNQVYATQRGRPQLNDTGTTFVGDNGQLLRGPFTSTEWTSAVPSDQIANIKNLGFNAVHLYAECFDANYPGAGSTAPGYAVDEVDKIVKATRDAGLYLVMTIGNGANNGSYNAQWTKDFWSLYAKRYANETHVLFEIQNEPVAWGPPYSSKWATPKGAVDMEIDTYKTIRKYAPDTPVLLFSYAVPWGKAGATDALKDIHIFNSAVFGNENAVWTNEVVAFHGYSGWSLSSEFAANLLAAGYPCFMTEFTAGVWGKGTGGLDVDLVSELESLGISWLTFQYVPPTGVSDEVTIPVHYANVVENSGLSWKPDYGNWPEVRGVYGNDEKPRKTTENFIGGFLTGTTHLEAEDFDWGGEGITYHDSNAANLGGEYRSNEAVDIQKTSDDGGGYNVCWTFKDEWLEYTISVQYPGYYDLSLRVANSGSGSVMISSNDQDKTGTWELPRTAGLQTWTTATKQVYLEYGRQKLRINIVSDGFNLNWIELAPVNTGPVANGTYKFINRVNAFAMTKGKSSDAVEASDYSDSPYQRWKIKHIGGGQYNITSEGNMWSMKQVILMPTGNGFYRLISAENGLNMQATLSSGTFVVDKGAITGDANQEWSILTPSAPAFPTGLNATYNSSGQAAKLSWKAMTGAVSYNLKRSEVSGGPYTVIATGITDTNYSEYNLATGSKYYYMVSAVTGEGETLDSAEAAVHFPRLTGTVIGTEGSWSDSGNTTLKVFDGDLNTYFDAPTGNDCFVGLDFGSGMSRIITQINYCPRSDFPSRMVGGIFQGANQADFSDAVTLYTITSQPAKGVFTSVDLTNTTAFRYIRYLSPNDGFGNVAELEIYGYSATNALSGDIISDGQIDSFDFLLFKKHLLGMDTIHNTYIADLNADRQIDSLDYVLMKQYLLGTKTALPTVSLTPKFHCFLLLGQSNMAGYALSQDSDKVEDPRVLVLGFDDNAYLGRKTDQWDVACPPLHASWLDAIGPGDWFGKTMIQKVPAGDTIGLIPCAISGECIETFRKGEGTKYDWIIHRAQLAQQKGGVIEGIILHQGESNNGDPNWPGKVRTLVEDLRKDLNLGDVPFIAGELLYSGGCAGHNKLVNQLPDLIKNCYVVSASDLVVDPTDTQWNLHFSHDSSVTLGKRYAETMIQALGW